MFLSPLFRHIQRRNMSLMMLIGLVMLLSLNGFVFAQDEPAGSPRSTASSSSPGYTAPATRDSAIRDLETAVGRSGAVTVLVMLKPDAVIQVDDPGDGVGVMRFEQLSDDVQTAAIAQAQTTLLSSPALANAANVEGLTALPIMSMTVDAAGLAALKASPLVEAVLQDRFRAISTTLEESTTQIGLDAANGPWANGVTGTGWTVAIIDTGTQKNHPFLSGKVVSEACYGTNATGLDNQQRPYTLTSLCPGGVTATTAVDSGTACALPGCDHGTHIAGIAAGKNDTNQGVAPDATVISIKAFSKVTGALCGTVDNTCILARDFDILKGIDRVYELREDFKIAAINLSLGGGGYTTEAQCDADIYNAPYKVAAAKMLTAKIPIIAAAGNGISGIGLIGAMEGPACVSNIISVSSVGRDAQPDVISLFSNTTSFLELLAPGFEIESSVTGGSFGEKSGTSMATAHITGVFALMREHTDGHPVSVQKILKTLQDEGKIIADAVGNHKRVRVNRAFDVLTFPDKPILEAPEDNTKIHEPGVTFTWEEGEDTDEYRINVRNAANNVVFNQTVLATACADTCSVTTNTVFVNKQTFTWTVSAFNEHQKSVSAKGTFKTDYPGAPTLVFPAPDEVVSTPEDLALLVWSEVETADDYQVLIQDVTNPKNVQAIFTQRYQVDDPALDCNGTNCTFTVPAETVADFTDDHQYKWRVQARNELGTSNSPLTSFRIDFPGAPTLVTPAKNAVITTTEEFTEFVWSEISAATSYELTLRDIKVNSKKTIILKQVFPVGDADLTCDGTNCSTPVTGAMLDLLKNKWKYDWKVQARNDLGTSNSFYNIFTTDFTPPPVADLLVPSQDAVFFDPSEFIQLQWEPSEGAVAYILLINDVTNSKKVFPILDARYALTDPEVVCDPTTCTYLIAASTRAKLIDGHQYRWQVRADNGFSQSFSVKRNFRVQFPGKPVPTTPNNNATLTGKKQLTTFVWSVVTWADNYTIVMREKGKPGNLLKALVTPISPGVTCDIDTCVYTVTVATQNKLKNNRSYTWYIQASNLYGSDKSKTMNFKTRF